MNHLSLVSLGLAVVGMTVFPGGGKSPRDEVGQPAPTFSLPSDRGEAIALEGFRGHEAVLLAFFPKAFTPG